MSTRRSGWITGVVVMQLLYVLAILVLPVYLLVLTRTSETRSSPDAADEISGLRIAAAVLGVPALGHGGMVRVVETKVVGMVADPFDGCWVGRRVCV